MLKNSGSRNSNNVRINEIAILLAISPSSIDPICPAAGRALRDCVGMQRRREANRQ